jgi:hypothetical protein
MPCTAPMVRCTAWGPGSGEPTGLISEVRAGSTTGPGP